MNFAIRILKIAVVWTIASVSASAQGWRSELYPSDWQAPGTESPFYTAKLIQDFSYAGYQIGEIEVPVVAGTVFNVVTSYGADPTGSSDSTSAIQAAIDAAGANGGGVVYLPAGTYLLSVPAGKADCLTVTHSNIVIRGAGSDETFLHNTDTYMRNRDIIHFSSPAVTTGAWIPLSADLPTSSKRLPVASTTGLSVGSTIEMEWTFTDAWVAEHDQQIYWNSSLGYPNGPRYRREITAMDPNGQWIEVDVPTRYALFTRDNARVRTVSGFISECGVEDLAIGNTENPKSGYEEEDYNIPSTGAYDCHNSFILEYENVRDSWLKGVATFRPTSNTSDLHILSNGIYLNQSFRVSVIGCEIARAQFQGGGGNGYLYRLQNTQECLVSNSKGDYGRHNFVVSHAGTSGCVFHRCDSSNERDSDNHMHFSHSNLWDQCSSHNGRWAAAHRGFWGTVPHALDAAHSVYWNTVGTGSGGNVVESRQGRYGYVIGTSGTRTDVGLGTDGNTAPEDHTEGIAQGATLEPQSLYLDQLERRIGLRISLSADAVAFPDNVIRPVADVIFSGSPLADPESVLWTVSGMPTGAAVTSAEISSLSPRFAVSLPGRYTLLLEVEHQGAFQSMGLSVDVAERMAGSSLQIIIPVEADSYIQNGTGAGTNFGSHATLANKLITLNENYVRKSYLRFNLAGIAGKAIEAVELHEYFTSSDSDAVLRTSVITDDGWDESAMTWNNAPTQTSGVVGSTAPSAQDWLVQDVTAAVQAESDGAITFLHEITQQTNASPLFYIASKENGNAALHPMLVVTLGPPSLEDWLMAQGLSGGDLDPVADPDQDGNNNLLEAWAGTDPNESSGSLQSMRDEGELLCIETTVNADLPSGIIYWLEQSDSLDGDSWECSPDATWEFGEPVDGRRPVTVRIVRDMQVSRFFYRIRVARP